MENGVINGLIIHYLQLLFIVNPDHFGDKLINFQAYQRYFKLPTKTNYHQDFSDSQTIKNTIKKKSKSVWQQTKLKTRWDGFLNIFGGF
ncbi:MAG: hypothetical protein GXP45_07390 [bacterium]|nr:hypothetical protein [bacterium]